MWVCLACATVNEDSDVECIMCWGKGLDKHKDD